jgi:hypothetical protein
MIRLFAALLAVAALSACSTPKEPLHQIPIAHANVVPLALEDDFKIEKVTKFLNDPQYLKPTDDEMLIFERQRIPPGESRCACAGQGDALPVCERIACDEIHRDRRRISGGRQNHRMAGAANRERPRRRPLPIVPVELTTRAKTCGGAAELTAGRFDAM